MYPGAISEERGDEIATKSLAIPRRFISHSLCTAIFYQETTSMLTDASSPLPVLTFTTSLSKIARAYANLCNSDIPNLDDPWTVARNTNLPVGFSIGLRGSQISGTLGFFFHITVLKPNKPSISDSEIMALTRAHMVAPVEVGNIDSQHLRLGKSEPKLLIRSHNQIGSADQSAYVERLPKLLIALHPATSVRGNNIILL